MHGNLAGTGTLYLKPQSYYENQKCKINADARSYDGGRYESRFIHG
jgi:hypothetical protein